MNKDMQSGGITARIFEIKANNGIDLYITSSYEFLTVGSISTKHFFLAQQTKLIFPTLNLKYSSFLFVLVQSLFAQV